MFWRQTPRLFHLALKGRRATFQARQREQAALAWFVAALSRMQRMPPFDKFVGTDKDVRPQSPSEIKAILKAMFAGKSFPVVDPKDVPGPPPAASNP